MHKNKTERIKHNKFYLENYWYICICKDEKFMGCFLFFIFILIEHFLLYFLLFYFFFFFDHIFNTLIFIRKIQFSPYTNTQYQNIVKIRKIFPPLWIIFMSVFVTRRPSNFSSIYFMGAKHFPFSYKFSRFVSALLKTLFLSFPRFIRIFFFEKFCSLFFFLVLK